MSSLRESMLHGSTDLIERVRAHPFLTGIIEGTMPDSTFKRFTIQNYLRLREFECSLATLAAHAPEGVRDRLRHAMWQLHGDIELYEELAAKLDVNLGLARMTFACHSYVCFLHGTASMRSFEEAIAAFYGNEYALHDGWTHVKARLRAPSPWQDFIDLWSGEGIGQWVESLAGILDSIAPETSKECRQQMIETFRMVLEHRLQFWDMAFEEADW